MKIFPAIDIKDKKCVRLVKGDFDNKTEYKMSPVEQARKFKDHGFKNLHIVDLDGALTGETVNLNIIQEIVNKFDLSIEVGCGVRNIDSIQKYTDAGVEKVILGSAAIKDKNFLKEACQKFPNKITSGSNSFQIMDGLFINFKKFSILRNTNNTVYLVFNGEIKYILGSSTTKLGNMAYYFSEIENKIFVLDGICMVKCSKFFSNFDQIIEKSFNQKSSINNVSTSADKNIVEQLEQLNSLFKSGVLTEEEFEKVKKKILN